MRHGREGCLLCLVLDASGSMGARRRMARVKAAVLELLRDAYERRDRVAVIAFRDARAQVVAAPGAPLGAVARALAELPTGGRTPLAAGPGRRGRADRARAPPGGRPPGALRRAHRRTGRRPTPQVRAAAARLGAAADGVWVIDAEEGPVRLGLAAGLAAAAGAELHALSPAPIRPRRAA